MQRFEFLRQPLMGELAMSPEERKREREKMPFVVATYVYASSQGQRTHSARTKIYCPETVTVRQFPGPEIAPCLIPLIPEMKLFQDPEIF